MEARRISIKPDTPELASLCDAISRSQGNPILEAALSQYVSRLIVATMADPRALESLFAVAEDSKARAKQERIEKLRTELAKLEAE
ncbi:hypothetical protein [Pseudomonas sp. R32]|uniref:hypothetical protein n=1 Tax=Pseudomonas sp. R32 TaxID=1573704 RepID=UPI00132F1617|nr:hypothetical protein [Pseudomonas sp. R32]QHF28546.1 hypothetical protein PspR32_12325 [Pseudomonas sp. R32]